MNNQRINSCVVSPPLLNVSLRPIASFRGDTAIQSLSDAKRTLTGRPNLLRRSKMTLKRTSFARFSQGGRPGTASDRTYCKILEQPHRPRHVALLRVNQRKVLGAEAPFGDRRTDGPIRSIV
jgi:hypothetical protein